MSNLPVPATPTAVVSYREFTTEEKQLIKAQAGAKDLTEPEFKVFLYACARRGLDPLLGELIPEVFSKSDASKRTVSYVTPIKVMRAKAAATGLFGGITKEEFYVRRDGKYGRISMDELQPNDDLVSASCLVWRKDVDKPFLGTVQLSAVDKGTSTWRTMKSHMAMKCAHGDGLRKAFPEELGGLYIREEMPIATVAVIEQEPLPAPEPEQPTTRRGRPPKAMRVSTVEDARAMTLDYLARRYKITAANKIVRAKKILREHVQSVEDLPDVPSWDSLSIDHLRIAYEYATTKEFDELQKEFNANTSGTEPEPEQDQGPLFPEN